MCVGEGMHSVSVYLVRPLFLSLNKPSLLAQRVEVVEGTNFDPDKG